MSERTMSRRNVLAAGASSAVALLPATGRAVAGTNPDAELIRLADKYQDAVEVANKALEAANRAEEAYLAERPDLPEVKYIHCVCRPSAAELRTQVEKPYRLLFDGMPAELVKEIRAPTLRTLEAAEVVEAERERLRVKYDLDRLEAVMDQRSKRERELEMRIFELPAYTTAGLEAKARAISTYVNGDWGLIDPPAPALEGLVKSILAMSGGPPS